MMRWIIIVVCVTSSPSAAGQPPASGPLKNALASFNKGNYRRSRRLLIALRRQITDRRLLAQIHLYIGLSYAIEGDQGKARGAFRDALLHDPRVSVDPYRYKPAIVTLFATVRRSLLGGLHITVDDANTSVWLDGKPLGAPPIHLQRLAGRHWLQVRSASGVVIYNKQVLLSAGHDVRLVLALSRSAKATLGRSARASGRDRERARSRRWTWVAGAVSLTSAAVAVGLGLSADSDYDKGCGLLADADRPCDQREGRLRDESSRQQYQALRSRARSKAIAASSGASRAPALSRQWCSSSGRGAVARRPARRRSGSRRAVLPFRCASPS